METKNRGVSDRDMDWSTAIAIVNKVVDEKVSGVQKNAMLSLQSKLDQVTEIEKAWRRILIG